MPTRPRIASWPHPNFLLGGDQAGHVPEWALRPAGCSPCQPGQAPCRSTTRSGMLLRMTRFDSVWLKLSRAEQHIDDLEAAIIAFHRTNPYPIITEDDPQTGKRIARVGDEIATIPSTIPLILGDAVHAIRSSLDHFAYAADPAQAGKTKTAFPIWRNETVPARKELKSLLGRQIGRASEPLKKALLALEPYQGGHGEKLWLIDQLDIIDKHRLLVTIGISYESLGFDAAAGLRGLADWTKDLPVTMLYLKPASRYPVQPGTKLFIADASSFDEHEQLQFTFNVAFGEPQVLEGQPLVPTLRGLLNEVKGLLKRLIPLV
jgi:hypothetical protein